MAKTVQAPRRVFNLLKPYIPPPTGWDKVYEWLLGKARSVLIVAEILVALTFVGKVVVDTQAKNLEDEIKVKDFELQRFASTVEPILVKLQRKEQLYIQVWQKSSKYAELVREIYDYIPNPAAEILVTINKDELTVAGKENYDLLAEIERKMKESTSFSTVSLLQLNTGESRGGATEGDYIIAATIANVFDRESIIPTQ